MIHLPRAQGSIWFVQRIHPLNYHVIPDYQLENQKSRLSRVPWQWAWYRLYQIWYHLHLNPLNCWELIWISVLKKIIGSILNWRAYVSPYRKVRFEESEISITVVCSPSIDWFSKICSLGTWKTERAPWERSQTLSLRRTNPWYLRNVL
jgi:hypothetical protein